MLHTHAYNREHAPRTCARSETREAIRDRARSRWRRAGRSASTRSREHRGAVHVFTRAGVGARNRQCDRRQAWSRARRLRTQVLGGSIISCFEGVETRRRRVPRRRRFDDRSPRAAKPDAGKTRLDDAAGRLPRMAAERREGPKRVRSCTAARHDSPLRRTGSGLVGRL
jgi:hypothetical protein